MPDAPRVRLSVLAVVVFSLFAALFGRLWYLQVAAAPQYEVQRVTNNLRTVQIKPDRGRILDIQGRVLVDNKRTLVVTIEREEIAGEDRRAELFTRLSGVLEVPADDLEERYQSGIDDRYLPFPLAEEVTEATANYLKERREDFPGVEVVESWQRVYRYGPIGANIIGYMARINDENKDEYLAKGYGLSDRVGAAGIEKYYEAELHGKPGTITYEVDARERIVRVVDEQPAVPGNDILLNLDIQVQQLAEQVLRQALIERRSKAPRPVRNELGQLYQPWGTYPAPSGAVVIEDPATGSVVAMASNPPFDPRWFEIGISQQKFEQIFGEGAGSPLFDRTSQGQYAPASTFKPFVAYSALKTGFIGSPYDTIEDQGKYTIDPAFCTGDQCTFQNAGAARLGTVDLPRALTVSSDVFFYRLGDEMWRNGQGWILQDGVKEFGFGSRTGVQLPGESSGLVPTPDTRKEGCEANPDAFTTCEFFLGDAVQLAIGQGDMLATPLQMANAYSALANGGTVWRPNVVRAVLAAGTPDVPPPAEPACPDPAADPATIDPATVDPACVTAETTTPETTATTTTADPAATTTTAAPAPPVPTRIRQVDLTQATNVRVIDQTALATIAIPPEWRTPMLDGLGDVMRGSGTAAGAFAGFPLNEYPLAGKTGTAQDVSKANNKDSSLFSAFGPLYAEQQYTVTAVLEEAGYGADAAAPVVRRMFEALLGLSPLPDPQDYEPLDPSQEVAGVLPAYDGPPITGEGGRD